MAVYRQVGGRLGAYIRAKNPTTQQIQGFLAGGTCMCGELFMN